MLSLSVYEAALRGEGRLDGVACVAPELSSVFHVVGREGALAMVGATGGGSVSVVDVPASFVIERIERDGAQFVVTAADGRQVRGTPEQFANQPFLIGPDVNPAYEQQLEREWLRIGDRSGSMFDTDFLTVRAGELELEVGFDSHRPRMAEAERILASFDLVLARAIERLGDGAPPWPPGTLIIYRSGDFALHFDSETDDGYWPAVQFLADFTAVDVTFEA
jgi:hypothetical protein